LWKFYACKIYRKRSGRNFTIYASENEAFCHEVQTHFEVLRLQGLQNKFWAHVHGYASKNEAVCREVETHFGSSPSARFAEKSSGRIFTICVPCKQTFLTSTFCKNALGTFYNFTLP